MITYKEASDENRLLPDEREICDELERIIDGKIRVTPASQVAGYGVWVPLSVDITDKVRNEIENRYRKEGWDIRIGYDSESDYGARLGRKGSAQYWR